MSSMNFTCDVCGREVFSCTFVNGMKFCAKCYQETFGETDKDRKIADLEAKLAESESKRKSLEEKVKFLTEETEENFVDGQKYNQLKHQLEKSEKSKEFYRLQNEQHHLQLLQFYSRLGVEAFGADIHEKALETLMIMKEQLAESKNQCRECKHLNKKIELNIKNKLMAENCELQKQLAEKTLTIEQINKAFIENRSLWKGKYERANQDKISFAIEYLENVKENIKKVPITDFDLSGNFEKMYKQDAIRQIDNQIKQLKEIK